MCADCVRACLIISFDCYNMCNALTKKLSLRCKKWHEINIRKIKLVKDVTCQLSFSPVFVLSVRLV